MTSLIIIVFIEQALLYKLT